MAILSSYVLIMRRMIQPVTKGGKAMKRKNTSFSCLSSEIWGAGSAVVSIVVLTLFYLPPKVRTSEKSSDISAPYQGQNRE